MTNAADLIALVREPHRTPVREKLMRRDIAWLKRAMLEASVSSKDPDHKVAAIAVMSPESGNVQVASGYNGFPRGTMDSGMLYEIKEYKDAMVVHAEANLICNAARFGTSLLGSTVYVTHPPCIRCAAKLVQVGVSRVVCIDRGMSDRFREKFKIDMATRLFEVTGVAFTAYKKHAIE